MAEEKKQEGCLIDLDAGEGSVVKFDFVDDFRRPCRILNIVFGSTEQLFFKNDGTTYFKAIGSNWEPYQLEETYDKSCYYYTCQCHPAFSFLINTEYIEDTEKLASALQLELTDNSEVIEFPVPLKNLTLMRLAWELRKQSAELNWEDLSQSAVFYYDGSCAMSGLLGNLLSEKATDLNGLSEQFFPKYIDDRYEIQWLNGIKNLGGLPLVNRLNKLVKRCISVQTNFPLQMFHNYTIPEEFNHTELPTSLTCIRQTADSSRQTHPYISVLAELVYEE